MAKSTSRTYRIEKETRSRCARAQGVAPQGVTPAKSAASASVPSRRASLRRRRPRRNGSTPSATARPRAAPACATCSAARAPASPRWPISACRCRPASPSRPRSARTSTPTARPIRRNCKRRSTPRSLEVGRITGKGFGDGDNPLLVSVRSGARASMPGMMDTVLNLGLNDETVEALARKSGDRRFAYDSYRRFITMYSDVVLGIDHHHFEEILDDHKDRNGYTLDTDLVGRRLDRRSSQRYKERLEEEHGEPFPQDPHEQLWGAIGAVFGSWMNAARHHLSAPAQHPGKLGHRGQRAGHGVRQHGRDLGDRRRLHAQSLDRRQAALRRVPDQRPGRGRGRRHPHAAGDHRGRAQGSRLRQAVDGNARCRRRSRSSTRIYGALETPLPRHAGPRVHGRAGQAVDAADPLRQAHRQGGAQDRGRACGRGADHPRGGGDPHRPGRARPAPASDHRSQCRAQRHRDRAAGLARRGVGRDRVLGRRGRDAQGAGTRTSSWCGSRRRRRTSTACTRPRASSPPAAA